MTFSNKLVDSRLYSGVTVVYYWEIKIVSDKTMKVEGLGNSFNNLQNSAPEAAENWNRFW